MKSTAATAFEVLDVLGLAHLVKRRGDLGGSVALRAVKGCSPLFEGNAFGFQIALRHPVTLRRDTAGLTVEITSPYRETFTLSHRAVLPRLLAQGVIRRDDPLATTFADDFIRIERTGTGRDRARLWTGLCVRPDAGVWLRASATANRRNRFIEVEEQFIADDGAFTPLILTIELPIGAPDRVILEGEIATLAPVSPGMPIDEVTLAQAPEIGAAHANFYDESYFEAKQRTVTSKYRKLRLPEVTPGSEGSARCRLILVGPRGHAITGPVTAVDFSNQIPFEATYDGYAFAFEPDKGVLRSAARAVEQTFAQALGSAFLGANRRAMLYFTNYFTAHPPGEPHFFVKPWAFMQTPPGWSCLLEGVHGDGFDVLRGVVATDVFHAMPAVFQVYRAGRPIRVEHGDPLLRVIPIPRRLLDAGFRSTSLRN